MGLFKTFARLAVNTVALPVNIAFDATLPGISALTNDEMELATIRRLKALGRDLKKVKDSLED
jgi:hypothetical protein